jgi:hypothetical protein
MRSVLIRITAFFSITTLVNLFSWFYGVIFSAIYPKTAESWLYCSITTFILSVVFELLSFVLRGAFWFFSKKTKNV